MEVNYRQIESLWGNNRECLILHDDYAPEAIIPILYYKMETFGWSKSLNVYLSDRPFDDTETILSRIKRFFKRHKIIYYERNQKASENI